MHYNHHHQTVGKSRSSHNTSLNTSHATAVAAASVAAAHVKSEWRQIIHQNSWLCSLIPPKLFFVSLYLLTIIFWSCYGMICGGKVSGSCPLGILQAFAIFNENGRDELRNAMKKPHNWHNYEPPSLIILLFAWYSIIASSVGLFAYRRALQYARHGRYVNGRTVLHYNPRYLLIPSILGYVFTFLLLFFWTFFVVEDQIPDITKKSPDAKSILTFIFMTLFPLVTIWSGFFYVTYGLVRSILFMQALLHGWDLPPPLPQRMASFTLNASGNYNKPDDLKASSSRPGSIRRVYRELTQTISSRKVESSVTEPLNPLLETTTASRKSEKLESILEVPE